MLFCFGDSWLVTGDSEVIHRVSFVGLRELVDMALAPYPTLTSGRGDEVYRRDNSFSNHQISLKMCALDLVWMDSEMTLPSSDFMSLYLLTRKNEGKNEHSHVRFWLILVRRWKARHLRCAVCSDRLPTAYYKRLTSHLSLYLYNQKFYAKNEHFYR